MHGATSEGPWSRAGRPTVGSGREALWPLGALGGHCRGHGRSSPCFAGRSEEVSAEAARIQDTIFSATTLTVALGFLTCKSPQSQPLEPHESNGLHGVALQQP